MGARCDRYRARSTVKYLFMGADESPAWLNWLIIAGDVAIAISWFLQPPSHVNMLLFAFLAAHATRHMDALVRKASRDL